MAALIPSASATGSGTMTLAGPSTNSNQTVSIPDATGTMMVSGNMPAFSAYASASQSVSVNTATKVTLDTEQFDTNNNFSSSRFTPTVAGYYQLNGIVRGNGTGLTAVVAIFYKNGATYSAAQVATTSTPYAEQVVLSDVIYLNGSTDYVELYGVVYTTSGATFNFADSTFTSKFSGVLVRSA